LKLDEIYFSTCTSAIKRVAQRVGERKSQDFVLLSYMGNKIGAKGCFSLYCSLPRQRRGPCPLAIKTPFKTFFGSFISKMRSVTYVFK